ANPAMHELGWFYNQKELSSQAELGIYINNSTLLIEKAKRTHSGSYQCWAVNEFGKGWSEEVNLNVQYPPECVVGQRMFYGVYGTKHLNVVCELDANPQHIQFEWSFNGTNTDNLSLIQFSNQNTKSVAVYQWKESNNYSIIYCFGKNRIGIQNEPCTFIIMPATLPEIPQNCSIENIDARSARVNCTPAFDGGLPQSFHLEVYNEINGNRKLWRNLTSNQQPYFELNNLSDANVTLNFIVYSSNAKGRSANFTINGNTLQAFKWRKETSESSENTETEREESRYSFNYQCKHVSLSSPSQGDEHFSKQQMHSKLLYDCDIVSSDLHRGRHK
ncbi:Cell adhesion molecule 2-like protein, partial [Dinothrombium tinctorium]